MSLTNKIKTALLHYLRFKKQSYVATEVALYWGIADVLFIPKNKEEVLEIEIKISKADFLNEWKKKEHKHTCITSSSMNQQINYFYFCVPKKLQDFALEQIKDKPYGLMIFDEIWEHKNKLTEKLDLCNCVSIVKNGKRLLEGKSDRFNVIKDDIALRAMSDLATMYRAMYYETEKGNRLIIREKEVTI